MKYLHTFPKIEEKTSILNVMNRDGYKRLMSDLNGRVNKRNGNICKNTQGSRNAA
jgi:hypothetical protein